MHSVSKHLGTVLIVLSFIGLLIVALPFVLSRLPSQAAQINQIGYYVSIPKIQAVSPIVVGVDPWNQTEYNRALSRGIAQAKDTFLPGQNKLTYLFAHSSGLPWEILSKNVPFLRLGELKTGDQITLTNNGKEYVYTVKEKKVVAAGETKYLKNTGEDVLILQTCWPIGTDWRRLLVIALPVNSK
ncbi:MAG: sortase [Candidatus Levybacteria bacterium]|nr:sortase [Candidatus Levybacteria bacterium]